MTPITVLWCRWALTKEIDVRHYRELHKRLCRSPRFCREEFETLF